MKWNGFAAVCICGKLCTSKPGLTMHHKHCKEAQASFKKNGSGIQKTNIIESELVYTPMVKELVDLVRDLSIDAHYAITEKNKSAGRRARVGLNRLKHKITPLRKVILQKIKIKRDSI